MTANSDKQKPDGGAEVAVRDRTVPAQAAGGRAVVPFETNLPNLMPSAPELEGIIALAKFWTAPDAGLLPKNVTPQQVVAMILRGREAGVGPTTALQHYFIVNGRPEPDTQLMLAIAMRNDPSVQVNITGDATSCTASLTRGGTTVEFTYTMEDAQRSGQAKVRTYYNRETRKTEEGRPGPWQLYPADMLRWAALKRCLKVGAPDLINTVHATLPMGEAERMLGGAQGDDVLDAIAIAQESEIIEGRARDVTYEQAVQAPAAGASTPAAGTPDRATEAAREAQAIAAQVDSDADPGPARQHLRSVLQDAFEAVDAEWVKAFLDRAVQAHPEAVGRPGRLAVDKLTGPDALALAAEVRRHIYGEGPPAPPPVASETGNPAAQAGDTGENASGRADGADGQDEGGEGENGAVDPDDLPFE